MKKKNYEKNLRLFFQYREIRILKFFTRKTKCEHNTKQNKQPNTTKMSSSISSVDACDKLSKVRSALEIDKKEMDALKTENAALKAEIEALKKAAAEANPAACNSEEMEKLKEENAQLKKTNERLNYRIMHMAMSLDELNAKVGNIVVPIKKP